MMLRGLEFLLILVYHYCNFKPMMCAKGYSYCYSTISPFFHEEILRFSHDDSHLGASASRFEDLMDLLNLI